MDPALSGTIDENTLIARELALRLLVEEEVARGRIARELHDGIGQSLVAARMLLGRAGGSPPAVIAQLEQLLEDSASRLHQIGMKLRPLALDELGLTRALTSLLSAWSKQTAIAFAYAAPELKPRLPAVVETTLYRITIEGLSAIAARRRARHLAVAVERSAVEAILTLEDDGSEETAPGEGAPAPKGAFASHLQSIRDRAALLGGRVEVELVAGRGTRLRVRLPLRG